MTEELKQRDAKAKKLGAVKCVEFEDGVIYFKAPSRHVLGIAMPKLEVNPVEANEIIINNCVIREVSDVALLENDSYFLSLISHVGDLLEVKKSQSRSL